MASSLTIDNRNAIFPQEGPVQFLGGTSIEAPNPCRLTARKEEEKFIIDILAKDGVQILPAKWVYGYTDKLIFVTDIPSSGHYGIWNEESKYYDEVNQLVKPQCLRK